MVLNLSPAATHKPLQMTFIEKKTPWLSLDSNTSLRQRGFWVWTIDQFTGTM